MNESERELAVRKLIRDTISRAWRESIACIVILIVFVRLLQSSEIGSANYYGCLLILVGTSFIAGVIWSFMLGYKLLESHPASDCGFWRAAFQTQARLLRWVPLWYCAPLCPGILLMVLPVKPGELPVLLLVSLIPIGLFAFVVWLNRCAAAQLDSKSQLFSEN